MNGCGDSTCSIKQLQPASRHGDTHKGMNGYDRGRVRRVETARFVFVSTSCWVLDRQPNERACLYPKMPRPPCAKGASRENTDRLAPAWLGEGLVDEGSKFNSYNPNPSDAGRKIFGAKQSNTYHGTSTQQLRSRRKRWAGPNDSLREHGDVGVGPLQRVHEGEHPLRDRGQQRRLRRVQEDAALLEYGGEQLEDPLRAQGPAAQTRRTREQR